MRRRYKWIMLFHGVAAFIILAPWIAMLLVAKFDPTSNAVGFILLVPVCTFIGGLMEIGLGCYYIIRKLINKGSKPRP